MRQPPGAALFVIGGLLLVTVGLAEATHSSARDSRVAPTAASDEPVPIAGRQLVCPDFVGAQIGQVTVSTTLGVAAPGSAPSGARGAGSVRATVLKAGAKPRTMPLLDEREVAALRSAEGLEGDYVLTGRGTLAPGLAADQFGRRDAGAYRGIDGVACAPPRGETWFVGAATSVGAHARLRLTNVDRGQAIVDVSFYGRRGPVQAPDSLGVAVRPRSTRVLKLETIAPGERLLLVHVQARSGRVAAALRQQTQQAATPQGLDWIPTAAGPAEQSVIPGVVAGEGPRRIYLANPGDTDATARLRVSFGDSSFVPRGLANVTVRAGSVLDIDATDVLGARVAGLVVDADQPLVTGARMATGPRVSGYAEQAWTAATPPLSGPTAAVVNSIRDRVSQLLLTAPAGAASVTIRTIAGAGTEGGDERVVRIPAGRTVGFRLSELAPDASSVPVTVTPNDGSGPVHAARAIGEVGTRSPLYTVLPMRTAPQVVLLPPVFVDPGVALPED